MSFHFCMLSCCFIFYMNMSRSVQHCARAAPQQKAPHGAGSFPCGAKYLLSSVLRAYWSIRTLPSSPTWTRPSARSSITSG